MTDDSTTNKVEVLELDIFLTLDTVQNNHGLAHLDYKQYWKYCTNKLSRIRHCKPVRTILVHNPKYEPTPITASTEDSNATTTIVTTKGTSNNKQQQQRKNGYSKRCTEYNSEQNILHENILWNLIYQSERCWAQACTFQQQQTSASSMSSTNTNGIAAASSELLSKYTIPKNKHEHIQRKFNKGVKFASLLVQTIQYNNTNTDSSSSSSTIIISKRIEQECIAYCTWMKGNAQLEHKNYVNAFYNYKECLIILLSLANDNSYTTSNNNDDYKKYIMNKDCWINRAETILRPLVRYCQYESKGYLSRDDLQLPTINGNSTNDNDDDDDGNILVSFRNTTVALDKDISYKDLAVLYLKIESLLKHPESLLVVPESSSDNEKEEETKTNTSTGSDTKYLQLLSDLDIAINLCQIEYNRYDSTNSTNGTSGSNIIIKRNEVYTLLNFFKYHKLLIGRYQQESRIVQLNTNNTTNPIVMIYAYDTLLKNCTQISDLLSEQNQHQQGTTNDTTNGLLSLEDDELWLETQAHIVRIRAIRCYHLVQLYEMSLSNTSYSSTTVVNTSIQQINSLLKHCHLLTVRAIEEIAAIATEEEDDTSSKRNDIYLIELESIIEKIKVITCRIQCSQFLSSIGITSTSIMKTNRPLWLRLNEWDTGDATAISIGGIENNNARTGQCVLPTTILADDPPLTIPIPCKGTFYDIAYQHIIENNDLSLSIDTIEQFVVEHEPKKGRGATAGSGSSFLGWFTGK